ncbi:tyrosine-type recombinase/integrase [Trichocoleus desertorum AS-A10]|uniref:tyrosine-type recombinase/integrase n=1 Tax=Trichocoleus desertorum TaxID=1481672 RepID=UPI003299F8CB
MTTQKTLADVLNAYAQAVSSKVMQNLRTTLNLYVLPGFNSRKRKKTNKDYSEVSLQEFFINAQSYFESAYNLALSQGKNENTLRNNRSHLNRFLSWIEAQPLYFKDIAIQELPKRTPSLRGHLSLQKFHKGRRPSNSYPYALQEEELTLKLSEQIKSLHTYLTSPYMPTRKTDVAIREKSWKSYRDKILCFLGWLHHDTTEKPINLCCPLDGSKKKLEELDITLLAEKEILNDYLMWHFSERGNGCRQALIVCITAINIAKWHYGRSSKRAKFTDCEQVLDIREIQSILTAKSKTDRRTTSQQALSEKLLTFEQCQEVVQYSRLSCAEKSSCGEKRSQRAIVDAWQNYLLIAILTFTPVRQREIRELELTKSLKREENGWWVTLTADGHKTGSKTGKSRAYPLFSGPRKEQLTHDLDTYVTKWRQLEKLNHNYLFFLRGSSHSPTSRGLPIPDSGYLSHTIPRHVFRATCLIYGRENGKAPSPHDFRRIFCNWLYTYGTLEEHELYAELMGHSVEEARRTYAMVDSRAKTERIDDAFMVVAERAKRIQEAKLQNSQFKKNQ